MDYLLESIMRKEGINVSHNLINEVLAGAGMVKQYKNSKKRKRWNQVAEETFVVCMAGKLDIIGGTMAYCLHR